MTGGRPNVRTPVPDRERLRRAAEEFVRALDVIDDADLLAETVSRVTEAWSEELLEGYRQDPHALIEPVPLPGEASLVLVRDIRFTSFCVHHLLPFHGVAHVAYLPTDRITGISKLARLVDVLARRLQIQERLTREIVDVLEARLSPRGAGAVVAAEHLCMSARGIRSRGSQVVTTAWTGELDRDPAQRESVLRALGS